MRVTYELTSAEFVAAQNLHSRKSPGAFIGYGICYLFAPAFGVFLMFGVISSLKGELSFSSILDLLFPILFILTPLWLNLYLRYRFKASRVSSGPCVIDFEEDRIDAEIPGYSKSAVEWIAIKKYRESKRILLIYLSRTSFFVIPRRACEKEEYPKLIALLKKKLAQRNR
jgi:hypothetical protein